MPAAPRVTLGVPVYNGERYLAQALDSLMAQDYDDLEIVVSDNASTDCTPDICRTAAAADARIRYERHEVNGGGVWNVNHLVEIARGREFKWAYYDDVVRPGFVAACTQALDAAGSAAVMAHTRVVTIDENAELLEERNDADLGLDLPLAHQRVFNLLNRLANQTEFGLMRTDAIRRTRGVLPFIGSEMFFLTEMAAQGTFVPVPQQLLALRRHPEQFGRDRFTEANWYSASGQRQSLLPFAKMNTLLIGSVLHSPLTAAEKARCAIAIARGWTWPRRRSIASDIKNLPRTVRSRRRVTGERPDGS